MLHSPLDRKIYYLHVIYILHGNKLHYYARNRTRYSSVAHSLVILRWKRTLRRIGSFVNRMSRLFVPSYAFFHSVTFILSTEIIAGISPQSAQSWSKDHLHDLLLCFLVRLAQFTGIIHGYHDLRIGARRERDEGEKRHLNRSSIATLKFKLLIFIYLPFRFEIYYIILLLSFCYLLLRSLLLRRPFGRNSNAAFTCFKREQIHTHTLIRLRSLACYFPLNISIFVS